MYLHNKETYYPYSRIYRPALFELISLKRLTVCIELLPTIPTMMRIITEYDIQTTVYPVYVTHQYIWQ